MDRQTECLMDRLPEVQPSSTLETVFDDDDDDDDDEEDDDEETMDGEVREEAEA